MPLLTVLNAQMEIIDGMVVSVDWIKYAEADWALTTFSDY